MHRKELAGVWMLRKLVVFLSEGARPADNSLEWFLPLRKYLSDLKLLSWQQIQLEFSGCTCLHCVIPPQGHKTLGSSFNWIKPSRAWTALALSYWNRMNWKKRYGLKAIKLFWPHLPIIFWRWITRSCLFLFCCTDIWHIIHSLFKRSCIKIIFRVSLDVLLKTAAQNVFYREFCFFSPLCKRNVYLSPQFEKGYLLSVDIHTCI